MSLNRWAKRAEDRKRERARTCGCAECECRELKGRIAHALALLHAESLAARILRGEVER